MSSSTRPASASLPLLLSLMLPMLRGAAAAFQCQQPATTTTVARHLHHHQQQQRRRSAPVMRTGSVFERLGRDAVRFFLFIVFVFTFSISFFFVLLPSCDVGWPCTCRARTFTFRSALLKVEVNQ
jgi:hypothetical protein